jgi:hypothetical protein
MAREAIRTYNATRNALTKCEAVRRTDGGLCQQIAMANGRCYLHGGRTPRGKDWHRPQPGSDAVKTQRKLKDIERAAKKRAKRLASMTPEERQRHAEWQKPTGPAQLDHEPQNAPSGHRTEMHGTSSPRWASQRHRVPKRGPWPRLSRPFGVRHSSSRPPPTQRQPT